MSCGAKRPRPCFPPCFLSLAVLGEGRETQAVQSRFCKSANTHLRGHQKGPLEIADYLGHPVRTSLRTLSDCHRSTVTACSITRCACAPSRRCCTPLRATLMALTWEGSPVVSQHCYGGLSSGLTASSQCRSGGNAAGFLVPLHVLRTSVSTPTKKPFSPNSATPASVYPFGRRVRAKRLYSLSLLADTDGWAVYQKRQQFGRWKKAQGQAAPLFTVYQPALEALLPVLAAPPGQSPHGLLRWFRHCV